jgi:hypothetical protein
MNSFQSPKYMNWFNRWSHLLDNFNKEVNSRNNTKISEFTQYINSYNIRFQRIDELNQKQPLTWLTRTRMTAPWWESPSGMMGTVESADAIAEALAAEWDTVSTKAEGACSVTSNTSWSNTSTDAVGTTIGVVPAQAAAERVIDAADRKPPFPRELMVGFPGESKAPTAALIVPATAVAIGVLLAVASGMEKGVETRRLDSLMGWEQYLESKEPSVAFCWFLLLEHWVAVLCLDQVMKVHVLHF